tara:strand:+ start:1357 stop:2091 length:735 start_codon:yes stop_codon:yes gene_type:complete
MSLKPDASGRFKIPPEPVNAVVSYARDHLAFLEQIYIWPFRRYPDGVDMGSVLSTYAQTLRIKSFLAKAWANASFEERVQLAEWAVRDWGGISSGSDDRIEKFVRDICADRLGKKFDGMASYSKILAAIDPERFAIYDSRVAASLNALQVIRNVENGLVFNVPQGRNKIVGDLTNKRGFSQEERFKPRTLVNERGWLRIRRDDTYEVYCQFMRAVLKKLPGEKLYRLEMLLFASAESLAIEAMN